MSLNLSPPPNRVLSKVTRLLLVERTSHVDNGNGQSRLHKPWVQSESAKESDAGAVLVQKLGIEESEP
jgi:hypothetical protein